MSSWLSTLYVLTTNIDDRAAAIFSIRRSEPFDSAAGYEYYRDYKSWITLVLIFWIINIHSWWKIYCIYLTSKLSNFFCNHDIQICKSGNPFYLEKPSLSFFYIIRKRTKNKFSFNSFLSITMKNFLRIISNWRELLEPN